MRLRIVNAPKGPAPLREHVPQMLLSGKRFIFDSGTRQELWGDDWRQAAAGTHKQTAVQFR